MNGSEGFILCDSGTSGSIASATLCCAASGCLLPVCAVESSQGAYSVVFMSLQSLSTYGYLPSLGVPR